MTAGIVIVGTGYCGVSAAMAARDAGFEGSITLIGDDSEWPYERPPLSKWLVSGPTVRPLFDPEVYLEKRIQIRRGDHVTAIERDACQVRLRSGVTIAYSHLLLATGAAPRRIDPQTWPSVQLRYLRTVSDAQALSDDIGPGSDVVIIGGGFIGLELAASLAERKAFVHVVEAQDRILARAVPPEISRKVHSLHEGRGVTIHTRTTIGSIQNGVAELSNGKRVRADFVVAGVGSVPNTELAASAGLLVDDGIVVNDRFETRDPRIFAAGDCCTSPIGPSGLMRLESWQVAGDQGRRAGQIIAEADPDPALPPWFWSDQFDHCLQVVGVPKPGSTRILRHLPEVALLCVDLSTESQIVFAAGLAPGHAIGRDIKLVQMLMNTKVPVSPEALADPSITLKSMLQSG